MRLTGEALLIRADASTRIGAGHLMRCLALAQAWQDGGGHVVFMTATESPALEARLESEGMRVIRLATQPGSADDAVQIARQAEQIGASWVVVDGYHFEAEYQRTVKNAGLNLMSVDDMGRLDHYFADLVLNQNIHAHEEMYSHREPYTRLLLGTSYVLLRREFSKWRLWNRETPETARRILVTLGGGDPDNVTLTVIRALQQVNVDGLEAVVVVGGSNPHYNELEDAVRGSELAIRLESNVTNMPELMAWAEAAVATGGSTSWELAFMGLPSLVVTLAKNQDPIARALEARGTAVNLGCHKSLLPAAVAQKITKLLVSQDAREEMSRRGRMLVNGNGALNVLKHMEEKCFS